VEGSCEQSNESSGSINAQLAASQEGLSTMELVMLLSGDIMDINKSANIPENKAIAA
jgi:hypothetical protein